MVKVLFQCIPYLIGFCFKEIGYTLCTALGVIVCVIEAFGTLIGAGNGANQPGQMADMITNVLVTVVFLYIYFKRSKKAKNSESPQAAPASAAEPPEAALSQEEPPVPGGEPRPEEAEKELSENHGNEG